MAFLLADRRGLLTKAWRTLSMFSGVLSEGALLGGFLFAAETVSLKFLTHNSTVLRLGTLSFRWVLKCRRNIRWVLTESLFLKYVSTAKARCCTAQRSMATEMLWVLLEGRSRTTSPRQRYHSQQCYKIVRFFCRTLYNWDIQYLYINYVSLLYVFMADILVKIHTFHELKEGSFLCVQKCFVCMQNFMYEPFEPEILLWNKVNEMWQE